MEERNDNAPRQLEYEYRVYKTLKGLPCIPDIHWFGVSDDYSFLVMEKLGPSLATLLSKESDAQMRGHPERANTTEAQRGISSRELTP